MKKYFSICLIAVFLVFSSTVTTAMSANNPIPIEQQQELPSWLAEVGAQIVPDTELAEVQGEWLLATAIMAGLSLTVISYTYYKFLRYCFTGKRMSPAEQDLFIHLNTGYEAAANR